MQPLSRYLRDKDNNTANGLGGPGDASLQSAKSSKAGKTSNSPNAASRDGRIFASLTSAAASPVNNFSPDAISYCDWEIEKYYMMGLPPIKCQQPECKKFTHHVCSIEWANANKLPELGIAASCREHHPQYCKKFIGTTNANNSLTSPDSGIVMHCPLPGSLESRMSIGTPDKNERVNTVVATSACAQKP